VTKAEAVKNRIWHSLSPETAAAAGLSLAELQQVIAGTVTLSEQQINELARHFGIRETA
jgi:hypothetical protein